MHTLVVKSVILQSLEHASTYNWCDLALIIANLRPLNPEVGNVHYLKLTLKFILILFFEEMNT